MNKVKLKVIRIDEDVIATSANVISGLSDGVVGNVNFTGVLYNGVSTVFYHPNFNSFTWNDVQLEDADEVPGVQGNFTPINGTYVWNAEWNGGIGRYEYKN